MSNIGYVLKTMVADFRDLHGASLAIHNRGVGNLIGVPLAIRMHIEGDEYLPVVQFLAESPQATRQILRLFDIVEEHELSHLASIGELIVGEDDAGAPQLELYIRVAAAQDAFREFKEAVHQRFTDSFVWDRHDVWPVILREL